MKEDQIVPENDSLGVTSPTNQGTSLSEERTPPQPGPDLFLGLWFCFWQSPPEASRDLSKLLSGHSALRDVQNQYTKKGWFASVFSEDLLLS